MGVRFSLMYFLTGMNRVQLQHKGLHKCMTVTINRALLMFSIVASSFRTADNCLACLLLTFRGRSEAPSLQWVCPGWWGCPPSSLQWCSSHFWGRNLCKRQRSPSPIHTDSPHTSWSTRLTRPQRAGPLKQSLMPVCLLPCTAFLRSTSVIIASLTLTLRE